MEVLLRTEAGGRPAESVTMGGKTLGSYEVVAKLGQGGMGEVWRARDTKLGRDVALKILPDVFAHDEDRVARFSREARQAPGCNFVHVAGCLILISSRPQGLGSVPVFTDSSRKEHPDENE